VNAAATNQFVAGSGVLIGFSERLASDMLNSFEKKQGKGCRQRPQGGNEQFRGDNELRRRASSRTDRRREFGQRIFRDQDNRHLWRVQKERQQRLARANRIGYIGNAGPALGSTMPSSCQ
jgi:hypothetical protein